MTLIGWVAYRIEVYRWCGIGPMYPLYRECVRRKRDLDARLAAGEPVEGVTSWSWPR